MRGCLILGQGKGSKENPLNGYTIFQIMLLVEWTHGV